MASSSNWLSGVNVVLVMAYGSLRQIMRFAMKSRRGPHVPVGHNAPKDLKEEIDIRLSKVQDVKYEPKLLEEDDARLLQLETPGNQHCYNYLYRMKALDAIRASEIPFHSEGRHPRSLMGKNFRSYLLELRNTSTPFKGVRKALIDTLLDGYETARYGTGVFGQTEYLHYQEALSELAAAVKARGGNSQRQHQSAAKDLTQSPEVSSPTTIQVTYLPSSQKSKRAKHFLELKSFKDNYNTLESTL
ncbi:protein C1orf43 homolog isoform X4 [Monodelphis domestica]|uniref:protein C1orf43 homolog isoform X4 n=1 Tax=Monodelphis domestica TaxID=13616 RepID=UPI0024E257DD|nr:protein C1orf43 homolog isoform X4 [Monodelphis domestica]